MGTDTVPKGGWFEILTGQRFSEFGSSVSGLESGLISLDIKGYWEHDVSAQLVGF